MILRRRSALTAAIVLAAMAVTAGAQGGEKYKIRLTPVPALGSRGTPLAVPNVTAASVASGIGNATATLSGKKLAVTGSFEKLVSPATEAHLFIGPAMGARNYPGVPLFHLTVMKTGDGKSGMLSGSFDLSNDQAEALKKGKFYLQVHSEGSPTGHLVGWLVKDAGK